MATTARIRSAHVSTSGRMVFIYFERIADSVQTWATAAASPPAMTLNGTAVGTLTLAVASANNLCAAFKVPAGVAVEAGDVVTLDAVLDWATTPSGTAQAESAYAVTNNAGRSCYGVTDADKTLRFGTNLEWYPTGQNALAPFLRNWAKRLSVGQGVATRDASGKPLTLTATAAPYILYQMNNSNGIDATSYPGPTGLFAIMWDDLDGLTSWTLSSLDSTTTSVVERTDLYNPGVGGMGKCRVYAVTRKVTSTSYATAIQANLVHPFGTPSFANLEIQHEADFEHTNGQPVSLDRSDPYAFSAPLLERLANAGSLRVWYNLVGTQSSSISEPEHLFDEEQFSYGWGVRTAPTRTIGYTGMSPFSTADTPYFYWHSMGERYAATLGGGGCDADDPVLTITDAATAPVIAGLKLFAGSELMRVDSVSGTAVSVTRGIDGTTPASHAAGAIEVGYRLAMPELGQGTFVNGTIAKFTTDGPHGLTSGFPMEYSGTWPTLTYTDGKTSRASDYAGPCLVTGPDTYVTKLGPYTGSCTTLTAPASLSSAASLSVIRIPQSPLIPYSVAARLCEAVDCPALLISIPHMATDDCVRAIARQLAANLPAGCVLWVELSNETWNFAIPQYFYQTISGSLYQGFNKLVSYVARAARAVEILREEFDAEGLDPANVKLYINVQTVSTAGASLLTWAAAQDPQVLVDGVALAPYVHPGDANWLDAATRAAIDLLDPDQAIDLWLHAQVDARGTFGPRYFAAQWLAQIATYNAATGHDCKLISYEGGVEQIYSSSATNYKQKDRDCIYHPNWHVIETDWNWMVQEDGYEHFNTFAFSTDWFQEKYLWGWYKGITQDYGRGDGSDGKANNLLCLARPGETHTKAASVNQDATNVSVRGYTWLAWNAAVAGQETPVDPSPIEAGDILLTQAGGAVLTQDGWHVLLVSNDGSDRVPSGCNSRPMN